VTRRQGWQIVALFSLFVAALVFAQETGGSAEHTDAFFESMEHAIDRSTVFFEQYRFLIPILAGILAGIIVPKRLRMDYDAEGKMTPARSAILTRRWAFAVGCGVCFFLWPVAFDWSSPVSIEILYARFASGVVVSITLGASLPLLYAAMMFVLRRRGFFRGSTPADKKPPPDDDNDITWYGRKRP